MKTLRLAVAVSALALVLLAGPVRAGEAGPDALQPPPALVEPAPADAAFPIDVTGRLRAGRDGLSLEVGGARFELRVAEALAPGEQLGGAAPGARDLRATFSVDGKVTNLLLRFVPAGTPPPPGPGE